MAGDLLIYGANGYTGRLIAERALTRGLRPILAGRRREAVQPLADRLALPARAFELGDAGAVRRGLEGVSAVISAAGPFFRTWRPLVTACLAAGVHYLDVTGEILVFESVLAKRGAAEEAGVCLVSGVGMDVVPTDCLAAMLAERLPSARSLTLALYATGGFSPGALKTMIAGLPRGGWARIGGRIQPVPVLWRVEPVPFPSGRRTAVSFPWGDVSTAYHTTGIPDVAVLMALPARMRRALRVLDLARPVLARPGVQRLLAAAVERGVKGQGAEARARSRVEVWGEVRAASGEVVTGALTGPNGYAFTADSAVRAAERVLAGQVAPGAWTPARAFGPGFVAECDGIRVLPFEQRF